MEVLLVFVLAYAAKKGWDDAWEAWRKSKSSYMRRADRNHPRMTPSKRAGHALRHDAGYGASQVLHGFPQARDGFATGWHQGRQAHARARAEREKAKAGHLETRARVFPEIREHRRRQREALEEIRRQKQGEGSEGSSPGEAGRPTRRADGKPETSADKRFFDNRESGYTGPLDRDGNIPDPSDPQAADALDTLDALRRNGEQPERDQEQAPEQQQEEPDTPEHQEPPAQPREEDETVSETTYQNVRQQMETAATEAEQHAAEAEQSQTVTEEHAEQARQAKDRGNAQAEEMQSLEVDGETLSAMADHLQALDDAEKRAAELNDQVTQLKEAWQRVEETAQQVKSQMDASGHGQLDEAHANAANGGAQKQFYGEG